MDEGAAVLVFVLVVVPLWVIVLVWHFTSSSRKLEDWAAGSGYRIIERQRRFFLRGPFFFWTARGQEVFHVTVEDAEGRRRSGYVKVGGWFLGQLSDDVRVRWDDERP